MSDCRRYEKELYSYLDMTHPTVLRDLAEKKDLKGEVGDRLRAALEAFQGLFQTTAA